MSFGLSGAALAGIAVGGATLISGMAQADAAQSAAETQAGASAAGIAEQRRQFDVVQKLLEPYVTGGTKAFEQQQALVPAVLTYSLSIIKDDHLDRKSVV